MILDPYIMMNTGVVVTHKDCLARFGIGIIEEMCKAHNAELVILNQSDHGANQKEINPYLHSVAHLSL